MDITNTLQAVSTIGFPIVACIFIYKNNVDTQNKFFQALTELKEALAVNNERLSSLERKVGDKNE